MNTNSIIFLRNQKYPDALYSAYEAYERGFGWAILNRRSKRTSVIRTYCSDIVEYDFSDAEVKRIRNLIHVMVDNNDIFDPNAESKHYEVAFFLGVVDGIEHGNMFDTHFHPRHDDLHELFEGEESEQDPKTDDCGDVEIASS